MIAHSVISVNDLPIFERATFSTPYGYTSKLADRACFFYILQGDYKVLEPTGTITLNAKEALVKNCGNYISKYLDTSKDSRCEGFVVYFHPEMIKRAYKNEIPSFLLENKKGIVRKKIIAQDLIDKFVQNILLYFEVPDLVDEELAMLKIKELVHILLKTEREPSILRFFSDIFTTQSHSLKLVVENNIFSNITINELAFLCNKSLSGFKREFKATFSDTPAKYIKNKRLERAATLLLSTKERVNSIAYDCGFNDVTTFSSCFSEKFKLSPRKYREVQIRKSLD